MARWRGFVSVLKVASKAGAAQKDSWCATALNSEQPMPMAWHDCQMMQSCLMQHGILVA